MRFADLLDYTPLSRKKFRQMIQSEGLQPLSRLPPERTLGEQFGVSRTVIREALKVLVARGVLKEVPGKGTFVWQNATEPLKDLFQDLVRVPDRKAGRICSRFGGCLR